MDQLELNPCKRMTVHAMGVDRFSGKVVHATNGNMGECTDEVGNCGCIHAEINLLSEISPKAIYVTHSPCLRCAEVIVAFSVEKVAYSIPYRLTEGLEYLVRHGVEVVKL